MPKTPESIRARYMLGDGVEGDVVVYIDGATNDQIYKLARHFRDHVPGFVNVREIPENSRFHDLAAGRCLFVNLNSQDGKASPVRLALENNPNITEVTSIRRIKQIG